MSKENERVARDASPPRTLTLMVVGIGDDAYAIPAAMVESVAPYRAPHPVPGSASHVEGVVNAGGRLVPVVSLRARMGIVGRWSPSDARTVLVAGEGGTTGFVVDEVRDVVGVDPRRYAAAQLREDPCEAVTGTLRVDGTPIALLDLPGLLAEGPLAA